MFHCTPAEAGEQDLVLVRRIAALRAYRNVKDIIARHEEPPGGPALDIWNAVMHVRMEEDDL